MTDPALGYVGFYGCEHLDRPVRVGMRERLRGLDMTRARRFSFHVECPCGRDHTIKPLWRRLNEREPRKAEVMVSTKDGIAVELTKGKSPAERKREVA